MIKEMPKPIYADGYITNARGVKIYQQQWFIEQARANILIIHGVGEHSGRYQEFAHHLAENNVATFSYDLQGFGRSGGKRGHINSFADYVADLKLVLEMIQQRSARGVPTFLMGHSLGSIITLYSIDIFEDLPIQGIIISGPPFRLNFSVPAWWSRMASLVGSILPAMRIKEHRIQLNMLTHDEKKIEEFRADPHRHYQRSIRFIGEYFKTVNLVFKNAHSITVPLLVLQGGDDDVVDVAKVREFFHAVTFEDKTLIIYPDMYHEVLNEVDRERVYTDILKWLDAHCELH